MIIDRLMVENGTGVNACLVVAHPDDESLWFGGLLATVPFEWTVICCSIPRADPIRAWKFYDACHRLNARGMVMPFRETDAALAMAGETVPLLGDLGAFDLIVTHSAAAEYGHMHHRNLHAMIKMTYPDKAAFGCYGDETEGDFVIDLTEDDFRRKVHALDAYDHRSPMDGNFSKGDALLLRYGTKFNLQRETYRGAA